jgi:ABC-2 type transport system permease protein
MSHTLSTARGIGTRSLRNILRIPSAALPALLMPIFQVVSFTGTYGGVTDVPAFPTDRPANWFLPLAVVMGSSFAGMSFGFATIRDLESGFYDRLRMAPIPRASLLLGGLWSATVRALIAIVVVTIVGIALGARFTNAVGVVTLIIAGLGIATIGVLWALGLVYRFRDMRAAALMQMTLFFGLFLTEAQMPIPLMEGWLTTVARYNPLNQLLGLARVGFLGDAHWGDVWPGLLTIVVLVALSGAYALRKLAALGDG